MMRKLLFAALALSIMLLAAGCGNGGPSKFATQIDSIHANDGEIEDTGAAFIVRQGNLSFVRAGVDPTVVGGSEFRAFLDFSFSSVPLNAVIEAATLDVFINDLVLQANATQFPILIELVELPSLTLQSTFFDVPVARLSKRTFVNTSDIGHFVAFDVTGLVAQAQADGVSHFQVRILQDFTTPPVDGVVQIEEASAARAPLLEVVYH